jgi:hypothetical protein
MHLACPGREELLRMLVRRLRGNEIGIVFYEFSKNGGFTMISSTIDRVLQHTASHVNESNRRETEKSVATISAQGR